MWSRPISKIHSQYFLLHLVVLIFGFTGVLGKLITVPALVLVWYRLLIAVVTIFVFLKLKAYRFKVDRKLLLYSLSIGVLVGFHWVLTRSLLGLH